MESDVILGRNELYAAMEAGKPYRSYIKTILGQVVVGVWDNFTNTPTEAVLHGDPRKKDAGCIVDVWSDKEDAFFKRINRKLFDKGLVRPYEHPSTEDKPKSNAIEQASDEELTEIVALRHFALLKKLNEIESVPVLFRIRTIAEEQEKSENIMSTIDARISELQNQEYNTREDAEVEED